MKHFLINAGRLCFKPNHVSLTYQPMSFGTNGRTKSRKYRGMFEVHSRKNNKLGKRIGLNEQDICKSQMGRDQVSG